MPANLRKRASTHRQLNAESGSALVIAILIMGALSLLGTTLVLTSVGERHSSGYFRDSVKALAVAETGVAFAQRALIDKTAPLGDDDDDGRPDFALSTTLASGGEFDVLVEGTTKAGPGASAYQTERFVIVSEGRFHGATRRVRVTLGHDSLLKYARLVAGDGTNFTCGTEVQGEVYANGEVKLDPGCGANSITFLELVSAVDVVKNVESGIFHKGYEEGVTPIDITTTIDFDAVRNRVRGLLEDCSCEGVGDVGIYFNLPGALDPLGIGAAPLNLSLFDFYDTTTQPPKTIITYNGVPVTNTLTGGALEASQFNGMIFFEDDAPLLGTLDGRSGRSISIFAADEVLIYGDIITGHNGFDPATGLPDGTGEPVNVGLIGCDEVYFDMNTCRVLRVDGAFFSCTANWRVSGGGIADHPVAGPGPLDLDLDGIWGETPVNHDPGPGEGWDELNITADTWVLNLTGPMISFDDGRPWPWDDPAIIAAASGPTLRFHWDPDIIAYPPPCFPVAFGRFVTGSWEELFDAESPLASYLPN
jgi:hypothetical protein